MLPRPGRQITHQKPRKSGVSRARTALNNLDLADGLAASWSGSGARKYAAARCAGFWRRPERPREGA